jgi:LEA14-like dessication related protein
MTRRIPAIAAAMLALHGCSSMPARDPLQVTVAGFEPMEQQGESLELRLLVTLRVQNPNSMPADYDGAYVKVEVQDRTFATGVSDVDGSIPGFGEAVVEVPVTVSMFRMFRNVVSMSDDAPADRIRYAMSGKLGSHRFSAAGDFPMKPPIPATSESI